MNTEPRLTVADKQRIENLQVAHAHAKLGGDAEVTVRRDDLCEVLRILAAFDEPPDRRRRPT